MAATCLTVVGGTAASRQLNKFSADLRSRNTKPDVELPKLEDLDPESLKGTKVVVVIIHGLLSTDIGQFDNFIKTFNEEAEDIESHIVGYPHDTLTQIDVNAIDLAGLVSSRIRYKCNVVFVCHSRGGLVARKAAQFLYERDEKRWKDMVNICVTFGTPHEGAELAEVTDRFVGRICVVAWIAALRGGFHSLFEVLSFRRALKGFPGITDLYPTSIGGNSCFLFQLKRQELIRPWLRVFAIGGSFQTGSDFRSQLSSRFFEGEENDLVVALSSTCPNQAVEKIHATQCDHFDYFDVPTRVEILKKAVQYIKDRLTADLTMEKAKPARSGKSDS
jgi:hypothetical protein